MKNRSRAGAAVIAGICVSLGFGCFGYTQTHSPVPDTVQKEALMTTQAKGTFEVKLNPQAPSNSDSYLGIGERATAK